MGFAGARRPPRPQNAKQAHFWIWGTNVSTCGPLLTFFPALKRWGPPKTASDGGEKETGSPDTSLLLSIYLISIKPLKTGIKTQGVPVLVHTQTSLFTTKLQSSCKATESQHHAPVRPLGEYQSRIYHVEFL